MAGQRNLNVSLMKDRKQNGFVLLDMLLSCLIFFMMFTSFLFLGTTVVKIYKDNEVREDLMRQGILIDETLYTELRFASQIETQDASIRFLDGAGKRSGFSVHNGTVYRLLSNGGEQPLSGRDTGISKQGRYAVKTFGNAPFFKDEGGFLHISFILEESSTGLAWPCRLAVRPLTELMFNGSAKEK